MSEENKEEKNSSIVKSLKEKIPHFLFEFLLVFLAVFCGFLADNQRETMADNDTAHRYMRLLFADLKKDTAEIHLEITRADLAITNMDSLLLFLYRYTPGNSLPLKFNDFDIKALLRLKIIFSDRTASQLKSSGQMRLIAPSVADEILNYWSVQEETKIGLDRYLIYRNRARQFSEQLHYFTEAQLRDRGLIGSIKELKVIKTNPDLWKEYANIVSHSQVVLLQHRQQLKDAQSAAIKLLVMLDKEYDLPIN
jgi:hypothetical protein